MSLVRKTLRRSVAVGVSSSVLGPATLFMVDRDAFDTARRIQRTAVLAATMLSDYWWKLRNYPAGHNKRSEVLEACHQHNAPRVCDLCFQNGGIYIKLGQLLGLMDHLLPEPYISSLAACFDACPRSALADVEAVFLEDFGRSPGEIFKTFDSEPIASASLAQVHRATLPSGQQLAIKVQHRALHRMVRTEIIGIDLILRCVRFLEPAFGFAWLADEIKENLPKELNFILEAKNSMRCREIMSAGGLSGAVVIPHTYPKLTSERVLVMDFEEGLSLATAISSVYTEGIRPQALVRRFSEAYAQMVFVHGFMHCDPHPGNMLWRRRYDAPGGFQLVLLDHGLYKEVSDDLRLPYCQLWQAIALGDGDGAIRAARQLGVKSSWLARKIKAEGANDVGRVAAAAENHAPATEDAEVFAGKMFTAMLTGHSFKTVGDERGGLLRFDRGYRDRSLAEDREEVGRYVAGYFRGILEVLDSLPRTMILLLKANDCLRALASRFQVPTSIPLAVCCRACCRALDKVHGRCWRRWMLSLRCWLFLSLEGWWFQSWAA